MARRILTAMMPPADLSAGAQDRMSSGNLHWIADFIWNIATEVLHEVNLCGRYHDFILSTIVIRWLGAVLEPEPSKAGNSTSSTKSNTLSFFTPCCSAIKNKYLPICRVFQ